MALIPESTIISLYRDIPITEGVAIHWDTRAQQNAFYSRHLITNIANCYYQRKHNGRTLIEWPISQVEQANYFTFRNPDFENITFYARILKCEYINNMTTEIQWEIDPWETYWDKLQYKNCFIAREQPSKAVWNRAVTGKPSVACKYDYYMTSPENLDVNKSLEKIYSGNFTSSGGDVSYFPNMPNESDYDLVLCLKLALPAEFDSSYQLDDDPDDGSQILFSALTGADGFSNIYATQLEKVPVTCVYLYCNMARNEVSRFTQTGPERMRQILNKLTVGDMSHSIVGMYALPRYWVARICDHYVASVDDSQTKLNVERRDYVTTGRNAQITIPDYSGYHPKLDMFPFRYLRVVSPDGSAKEYNYERFTRDSADFYIETNMGGVPTQTCVPYDYGSSLTNQQLSYQERIEFAGVPDCPYTIDNYLAWLSQQYSSAFGGFTMGSFAADTISTATNILAAFQGVGGSPIGTMQGSNSSTPTYSGSPFQTGQSIGNIAQSAYSGGAPVVTMAEADRVRAGRDDANRSRFSSGRRAFVGDDYHPGNGAFGQYLFDSGTGGLSTLGCYAFRFRFVQVDLREDIKRAYSDYLMTYGCTANRFGIPYVCSAIAGETDEEKLPSYVTLNGETFTYVKTSGISVFGVEYDAANRVAMMFDNGIRFLKGSEL